MSLHTVPSDLNVDEAAPEMTARWPVVRPLQAPTSLPQMRVRACVFGHPLPTYHQKPIDTCHTRHPHVPQHAQCTAALPIPFGGAVLGLAAVSCTKMVVFCDGSPQLRCGRGRQGNKAHQSPWSSSTSHLQSTKCGTGTAGGGGRGGQRYHSGPFGVTLAMHHPRVPLVAEVGGRPDKGSVVTKGRSYTTPKPTEVVAASSTTF